MGWDILWVLVQWSTRPFQRKWVVIILKCPLSPKRCCKIAQSRKAVAYEGGLMRWLLQQGKIGEAVCSRKWWWTIMKIMVSLIITNNACKQMFGWGRKWTWLWEWKLHFEFHTWAGLSSKHKVCKFPQMALIIDTNPQLLPTAPTWADFANGAFEQVGRPTVGRHVCWLRRNLEFIWVRRQWVRAGPAWHTGYFRLVHSITILTVPPSSLSSSLVSFYTSMTAFKLTYDHSVGQDFPDETMMIKNKGQNQKSNWTFVNLGKLDKKDKDFL